MRPRQSYNSPYGAPFAPLEDRRVLSPTDMALALKLVGETDLLRLKTIARLHARGLPPDVGWEDLLQEAFARVLTGSRRQPEGVTAIAFLAGVMRSLKADHWRRVSKGLSYGHTDRDVEPWDPAPDPEHSLNALQELAAIDRLFADDSVALQIIAGLSEGLSAEQIRLATGISKTDYDSGRKRMRRVLLREGLTSCAQR
jgi:DNA-directed RNA polymerase specialized sigma24 family protein